MPPSPPAASGATHPAPSPVSGEQPAAKRARATTDLGDEPGSSAAATSSAIANLMDAEDAQDTRPARPSLPPMASLVSPTDGSLPPPPNTAVGGAFAHHPPPPTAPSLAVKLLEANAKAPTRGSAFAAGYDVYANATATVPKGGRALVSTGIAVAVPAGTYARIAPRSGLAVKHGIATGAGVVDEDYRGEVKIVLFNHGDADFDIDPGDRIAQIVLERIVTPDVMVVEELAESVRGAGGFGSTGGFGGV